MGGIYRRVTGCLDRLDLEKSADYHKRPEQDQRYADYQSDYSDTKHNTDDHQDKSEDDGKQPAG